jgi:hypothetical protein
VEGSGYSAISGRHAVLTSDRREWRTSRKPSEFSYRRRFEPWTLRIRSSNPTTIRPWPAAGWILQPSLLISNDTCSKRGVPGLTDFELNELCCKPWRSSPYWARGASFSRFHDDAQIDTTLVGWSARSRHLYLTHKRKTSLSLAAFKPSFSHILISPNINNLHWDPANTLSVENSCPWFLRRVWQTQLLPRWTDHLCIYKVSWRNVVIDFNCWVREFHMVIRHRKFRVWRFCRILFKEKKKVTAWWQQEILWLDKGNPLTCRVDIYHTNLFTFLRVLFVTLSSAEKYCVGVTWMNSCGALWKW